MYLIQYVLKYPVQSVGVFLTLFPIISMLYMMDYRHRIHKYLFFYFVFKFAIELLMLHLGATRQNNLHLYNLSVLVGYCFIAMMFYEAYDIKKDRTILLVASGLFVVLFTIDWVNVGFYESTAWSGTLECMLIIAIILIYFWELTQSLKVDNLFTYPLFWICSGMLIHFATLTFVSPIYHLIDYWGATHDLEILLFLPSITEIFYLIIVGIGILISK